MAYLHKRNYVLGGAQGLPGRAGLGSTIDINMPNIPEIDLPTNAEIAVGDVSSPASGGMMGGSINLFGISVPILYLAGGALAGYFLGNKADGMRNAAIGAGAGVAISYFAPNLM